MKTNFLVMLIFLAVTCTAQEISSEVISSSGGEFTTDGLNMSWTIGESVTETFSSGAFTLTQGFQQPGLVISRIDSPNSESNFKVNVYPNPTTDYVNISCDSQDANSIVSLFDLNGKLLRHETIYNRNHVIDFQSYPEGTYLLKVSTDDGKESAKFKIVKTN